VPILGHLFKATTRTTEKTNLLLFITPYTIQGPDDLRRIFRRKIHQRREFIERYTAFKDVDPDVVIDYRHKRGLLAEIHRVALLAEKSARLRREARREGAVKNIDGPLRIDPRDRRRIHRSRDPSRGGTGSASPKKGR
jgi:general secretion pathway protein D